MKFQGCGSKIRAATLFRSSKLKWAWRAQFLSHALQIFGKFLSFQDVQMIVKSYFDIFKGIKSAKNQFKQ